MRAAVRAAWVDYNKNLEGVLTGMYADKLGLVTTGMGNLIDPIALALTLPWTLPNGASASKEQISSAWMAVKNDPQCAVRGWQYAFRLPGNTLRLSPTAVDDLIDKRLDANDASLKRRFPHFESWPADAQLAVHSMVWAMGLGRLLQKFPKCCKALDASDFVGAAKECKMVPEEGSLITRNKLNFTLLHNAATCAADGADPELLVWQP